MRWIVIIVAVLLIAFGANLFIRSKVMLHTAKARAEKEYANIRSDLNTVPLSPPRKLPVKDQTNTTWVSVAGSGVGVPADQFTRDSNPKRENFMLHHARYRLLVDAGHEAKAWAPVLQPLGETNFYRFVRTVLNATERDIRAHGSREKLDRHLLLLKAKVMMTTANFALGCVEFDRGDVKGFIIGDPTRDKFVFIRIYLERRQQFIDVSLIGKAPFQMSEVEELISALKVEDL
jgi:hypothetical protein